jgi:DNA-binding response OmpR family regulator
MAPEHLQRLADLSTQLGEALMTAAILADEIRTIARSEMNRPWPGRTPRVRQASIHNGTRHRPLVDDSTLSVFWAGRTCCLRNTVLFRLAGRLARQPNQYISVDQLLSDVWDGGVKSPDTIRSTVRRLRKRFIAAGMDDLAAAIHGSGGRYGLILDGRL